MLDGDGLALHADGLLHRDDVHPDARPAGGHHGGDFLQGQESHALKEGGHLGVLVDLGAAHIEKLRASGDEHRQDIPLLMVGVLAVQVLPVVLDEADEAHLVQHLLQLVRLHAGELLNLLEGLGLAHLHLHGHVGHLVGDKPRQPPVLRVLPGDAVELGGHPVGDHPAQLDDLLPGLVRLGDLKGQPALVQGEFCLAHVFSPLSFIKVLSLSRLEPAPAAKRPRPPPPGRSWRRWGSPLRPGCAF